MRIDYHRYRIAGLTIVCSDPFSHIEEVGFRYSYQSKLMDAMIKKLSWSSSPSLIEFSASGLAAEGESMTTWHKRNTVVDIIHEGIQRRKIHQYLRCVYYSIML